MVPNAFPSIPINFPRKPLHTRAIDAFDRLLFPLTGGIVPYSLITRRLLRQAEALSTSQDPWPEVLGGDAAHRCFLRELRYFFSVVRWEDLTASGRIVILASYLYGPIVARKKLRDALKADPDVTKVELKPFVVICGPVGSGTSLVQNIFASCLGSFTVRTMTALTWNINNNIPLYPCDEDELTDTIQKYHGAILGQMEFLLGRELLRGLDARHAMVYDPMEAQEDGMFLGANGIFLGGDIITGGAYHIQTGSPGVDPNRFRYHFQFLRVFYQLWQKNWRGAPVKRWIIKAPYYTRDLATCLHVLSQPATPGSPKVPVAALVGRRDARDMIPSEVRLMCLSALVGVAKGRGLDRVGLLANWVLQRQRDGCFTPRVSQEEGSEEMGLLAARAITYEYSDLVQDPEGYVKRLVELHPNVFGTGPTGIGMRWSDEWAENVRGYLLKNKEVRRRQKKEGLLETLSLDECGLTEENLCWAGIA